MNVSPSTAPRRRMRLGRVLVAAAVAASVLAVANDPAQGAAALVETRRLEGNTRFETAAEIAEAYVDQIETFSGRIGIDSVILTSGDNNDFAYALPSPALSRRYDAPLLLTRPNSIPEAVTTFLTRYEVSTVYILGGDSVVTPSVESAIDAISGTRTVRIAGDDAYSTAVAVAEEVGPRTGVPGDYSSYGRTALLATGETFADALAVGPLAYRGEHPILLTDSGELPAVVTEFLESSRTEHVIILGGTAAISTTVQQEVEGLGIEVTRWAGADRYETALEVAEALLGDDQPDGCFDGTELGMAYAWRSPDAIASGPLLGELCAPLLLTDIDEVPPPVEYFLASENYITGNLDGQVRITVFGGPAAVSQSAMDAAVDAARLPDLRARLHAVEGGCHFTAVFTEPVVTADAEQLVNYLNGNTPFLTGSATVNAGNADTTTKVIVTLEGASTLSGASVPTGCASPFRARDRIGVVAGEIASPNDRRRVPREEFFIDDDDIRPVLVMNAPEGSNAVWIESGEPLQQADVEVVFRRTGNPDISEYASVVDGTTMFSVNVPSQFGSELRDGDRVTIASREVFDLAGNENRAISRTVVRDDTPPRVATITVTDPRASGQAAVTLNATDVDDVSREALKISVNAGSSADGAVGNRWHIDVDVRHIRPASWSTGQLSNIDVSTSNRRITVQVVAAAAINDLADDLNLDRPFRSLFNAEILAGQGASTPIDTGGRVALGGGTSTVDLTVHWSEPVQGCDNPDKPVKPRQVEIDVDGDTEVDFALDGFAYDDSDVTFVADDSETTSIVAGSAACDNTTPGARTGTLVARVQSSDLNNLPDTTSIGEIRPGAATDLAGNTSRRQTGVMLRRPS